MEMENSNSDRKPKSIPLFGKPENKHNNACLNETVPWKNIQEGKASTKSDWIAYKNYAYSADMTIKTKMVQDAGHIAFHQ